VRAALVIAGALIAGWGGWLFWPEVATGWSTAKSAGVWILGGPVAHDLLLAPAVGALGVLVATVLPGRWRAPAAAGLATSGVLVLLALPGLLRPSAGPPNPGLADRDYRLGLAAAIGVVWLLVLLAGLSRRTQRSSP
jgi:hypothetical protein